MSVTKLKPTTTRPKAPEHLREATREWWSRVVADYELEDHHLRVLTLACVAWDRAESAREALDTHGAVFVDRWSQPRARPEVEIEAASSRRFAMLLRELCLDVDPPPQRPRPPGLAGAK